jgi:4-amino-4-deoxy-L-arabinose transferase-like glycosyltransferase
VVFLLACYLLFFHRLGDRDLWSSHEARAAMNAATLLEGRYPHLFDGQPEVQKPPLCYALVAGIAWLRGGSVDALAVRLPAALAAAIMVAWMVWGWGPGKRGRGLLTGLILATSIHFTWLARIGRIDMPLAAAVTLSASGFFLARRPVYRPWAAPKGFWLRLGYGMAAVGVLLKGPVGLVLPAAITACSLLSEGEWPACWEWGAWRKLLRDLGAGWGLLLVLVLTVPVYAWAESASGGQFCREFFWHHNLERGLGGARLRSHPWWLYGPFFLLYFLPWSPFLLLAGVFRGWRNDPLARFGLCWTLAVVAVLSCSHFKRADYLTPAWPGAALFLGSVLSLGRSRIEDRGSTHGPRSSILYSLSSILFPSGVLLVAALAVLVQLYRVESILPREEAFRDYRALAARIQQLAEPGSEVVFFRTEAHALAFHVGEAGLFPATVVEWQELRARMTSGSASGGATLVVLSPESLAEWPTTLLDTDYREVIRNTDLAGGRHERPLVVIRCQLSVRRTTAGRVPAD